jgi:hypothetical protein
MDGFTAFRRDIAYVTDETEMPPSAPVSHGP